LSFLAFVPPRRQYALFDDLNDIYGAKGLSFVHQPKMDEDAAEMAALRKNKQFMDHRAIYGNLHIIKATLHCM
jgi:hypothetical protein